MENWGVVCKDLGIVFHDGQRDITALDGLNLEIFPGEFVSVVGPSGCGKTTLLRAIAGYLKPSTGSIDSSAQPSRTLLVYQENSLFPWLNVLDNACFGLEARGVPSREREAIAMPFLRRFGLEGRERAWPHQLSVGMRQRVAVIRGFISEPELLLMDEPFAAVDWNLRLQLQRELLELWEQRRSTLVFVTHDVDEALLLSDRVLVMSSTPGRIVAEIDVSIDRPRGVDAILSDKFLRLKRIIFRELGIQQSERAHAG